MKKLIAGMLIFFLTSLNVYSAVLNGGISQSVLKKYNKVIDKTTKLPVDVTLANIKSILLLPKSTIAIFPNLVALPYVVILFY